MTIFFQAKYDDATNKTIRISTKPCPKCRTPTERDGENDRLVSSSVRSRTDLNYLKIKF